MARIRDAPLGPDDGRILDHRHGDMGGARHRDHYRILAARSSLLWPGIALAILAVIGLFGGFGFDYLAGHKP